MRFEFRCFFLPLPCMHTHTVQNPDTHQICQSALALFLFSFQMVKEWIVTVRWRGFIGASVWWHSLITVINHGTPCYDMGSQAPVQINTMMKRLFPTGQTILLSLLWGYFPHLDINPTVLFRPQLGIVFQPVQWHAQRPMSVCFRTHNCNVSHRTRITYSMWNKWQWVNASMEVTWYNVILWVCSSHPVQLKLEAVTAYCSHFLLPFYATSKYSSLYAWSWFVLLLPSRRYYYQWETYLSSKYSPFSGSAGVTKRVMTARLLFTWWFHLSVKLGQQLKNAIQLKWWVV